jgi:transposase-like protein
MDCNGPSHALQESLSVRKTAKKLDVSISTAFRWRHRLLNGLGQFQINTTLSGIAEMMKPCSGILKRVPAISHENDVNMEEITTLEAEAQTKYMLLPETAPIKCFRLFWNICPGKL